jgi:hypothetical protein
MLMAAHAGEPAWKTGTFICQSCGDTVRVSRGAKIPECPAGHRTYISRIEELIAERELSGHPHHGGATSSQSHRAAMSAKAPRWRHRETGPPTMGSAGVPRRDIPRAEARRRIALHKPGKEL